MTTQSFAVYTRDGNRVLGGFSTRSAASAGFPESLFKVIPEAGLPIMDLVRDLITRAAMARVKAA